MSNKSHLTAISRTALPLPTQWLIKQGLIRGHVLDYGCGRCHTINPVEWDNYDPHHFPRPLLGRYDTILCTYVMCVLLPKERREVLERIQSLLKPNGKAYISVNKARPKKGWGPSSKGTYQGRGMNLPLTELYSNANFRILVLTRETEL